MKKYISYLITAVLLLSSIFIILSNTAVVSLSENINRSGLTFVEGTKTIEDGTYTIKTAIDEKYVLDIGGASVADGGNVQLWNDCSVAQQKFKVKYIGNGCYSITSVHSNKLLDIASGSMANGANVQQWQSNGTDAQKWIIKDAGDGYYYVISKLSDLYLTVAGGKAEGGANIQVNTGNSSQSQKFKFEQVGPTIGTQTITDGTYTIKTAIDENYVLDIGGASVADGGNVQLWNNCSVAQQKFKVKYLENGCYSITSVHSNKLLDISSGSMANGANVQQWQSNGTDAQKWIIKDAGDGYYYVISKLSDLYLTVAGGKAEGGANIQVNTGNSSQSQKFKFERVGPTIGTQTITDGTYTIKTAINENYVLDIGGASVEDGGNVQLWNNCSVAQQKFKVKYLDNGCYSITSVHSNKLLDIASGSMANGANVQQWQSNGTDAQKWIIKDAGDGYYYIISKLSDLYLTVAGEKAEGGANIQVNIGNSSQSQKFKFEHVKTIDDGTYTIKTAIDENYVLDIGGASVEDGGNVQLWNNCSVAQQKFKVKYLGNGCYSITSLHSNKLLHIASGSMANGANVQQWQSNGTDAQKWIIQETGDGYYYIISKLSDLYLTVDGGKAEGGANVQVNTGSSSQSQKFKFEQVGTIEDGTYTIKTAIDENYVLDIGGASVADGGNVQLWNNYSVPQQKFKVKYIGNGCYTITSVHSKKLLDIASGSMANGANVQQWQSNGTDAQKWIIKDAGDGYYYIISKLSNLYLTVDGGKAEGGANIQVNTGNSSQSQKFKFEVTTNIDIDVSKYPGYKERIETLMESHPNWNFELLYTGIKFGDAVAGEYSVRKRNLVPTTYGGEWIAGTKLYDTGWYAASEKAIAYYMDPRNFLDDVNVFQFQDVNEYIDGVCTLEGIQDRVSNSFLKDYATDIDNACKNTNVNPYYIIARLFQENGRNPTSGTHKMDGGDGKYYYNPFNIGASGNSKEEVYNNALARAKREGWDTMTKALEGGIYFCKVNWLDNYQNTLYQNRFDIDTRNGTALYAHQYMQNLMGAYSEAKLLRESYVNTDKIESNFTFIIPVYEGMDSTISPMPVNNAETYAINVRTTGTDIRIRSEANTSSQILTTISDKGTILLSVKRGINSNWQQVVTPDGLIGYMSGDFLEQVDDVKTCNYTARVKTNDGNGCYIRIGPSIKLDSIRAISDGTEVTVIDDSTYKNIDGYDWSRVLLSSGTQGFMPSKFLAK